MLRPINYFIKNIKIIKPTNFVKTGVNIQHEDIIQLITEGAWTDIKTPDGKTKQVLQYDMQLADKTIKTYTMNNSTMDNLTHAYGDEDKEWINKDLKAHIVKEKRFGKLMNVLYLTPPEWENNFPPDSEQSIQQ